MRALVAVTAVTLAVGVPTAGAAVVGRADDAIQATRSDHPHWVGELDLRVALVRDGALWIARPTGNLGRQERVGTLPRGKPRLAGFEHDRNGDPLVLVEDEGGRWLVLAQRIRGRLRLRPVARDVPPEAVLGPAGLEVDRAGKPAVAYAYRLPDGKTFLRLVAGGTFRTIGITREGFPESSAVPAAAPVRMPDGTLRVLETYAARGGGAIMWRYSRSDWRGLFLSSSVGGTLPVGPAFAEANESGFAAAWTLAGPAPGELQVRLAPRADRPRTEVLHRRARVEALALGASGPEVGATESVGGFDAGLAFAEGRAVELDGGLLDLETTPSGERELLLLRNGVVHAFLVRPEEMTTVSLTARPSANGFVELRGRVSHIGTSTITIYREGVGGARQLAGLAAVAPDGSFSLVDRPPTRPVLYRAVYEAMLSRTPFAALVRQPV